MTAPGAPGAPGDAPVVDWTPFAGMPVTTTNTCLCGGVWRSHTKMTLVVDDLVLVAQRPCPKCGWSTRITRSQTDWESYEL